MSGPPLSRPPSGDREHLVAPTSVDISPVSSAASHGADAAAPVTAAGLQWLPAWCRDYAIGPIVFYFISSISLTLFNKWFFSSHNPFGFSFPLTVTCVHQALVWVLLVSSESRLKALSVGDIARVSDLRVPLGFLGCLCGVDWGLSNYSLHTIPLSLYEMTKSASPAVVLLVSIAGGLVLVTGRIALIVLLICTGMFLAVSGGDLNVLSQSEFPLPGFICVSIATLISGSRVVYAQFALQRLSIPGVHRGVNAVTMLYYAAPTSSASLIVPAMVMEGHAVAEFFRRSPMAIQLWVLFSIVSSALIAYALSLSEFVATKHTSALTLCIVGVTKQLMLIAMAMGLFGDKIGPFNVLGFAVALCGVALYNYSKRTGAGGLAHSSEPAACSADAVHHHHHHHHHHRRSGASDGSDTDAQHPVQLKAL